MGLDMFLSRKRSGIPTKKNTIELDNLKYSYDDTKWDEFDCSNSVEIVQQVGYWRKANAIHGWFVNNVQAGEDDCKEYYVTSENLDKLYDICKTIVDKLDGKILNIDPENKKFYDTKNKEAKDKGEKKPYPYTPTLKFNAKNLKAMWKKIGPYNLEDKEVIKYCEDNLPTSEGFFFGETSYHGWYLYDVIKTILIIKRIRQMMKEDKKNKTCSSFYYSASW